MKILDTFMYVGISLLMGKFEMACWYICWQGGAWWAPMASRLLLRSQQRHLSLLSSNPSLLMFSDQWLTCMRSRRHQHKHQHQQNKQYHRRLMGRIVVGKGRSITSKAILGTMSVKDLRKIIHEKGLTDKDCIDKDSLMERAAEALMINTSEKKS